MCHSSLVPALSLSGNAKFREYRPLHERERARIELVLSVAVRPELD